MAAKNFYVLTLVSITPNTLKDKIAKVKYNVALASNQSNVDDLVKADFKLLSGSAIVDSDWDLVPEGASSGNYEVEFISAKELALDAYLVVNIEKSGNKSDKLFVDFSETLTSGAATFSTYNVASPGQYYFVLNSADETTLNKQSATTYDFNNLPDATNSSIVPIFDKPYLAQIIPDPLTGLNVSITVTLKDSTNADLIGNNELSFYAQLQA